MNGVKVETHGLLDGRPLCAFTFLPPANWPQGHFAVPPTDLEHMTCPKCRHWAKRWVEARRHEPEPLLAHAGTDSGEDAER